VVIPGLLDGLNSVNRLAERWLWGKGRRVASLAFPRRA